MTRRCDPLMVCLLLAALVCGFRMAPAVGQEPAADDGVEQAYRPTIVPLLRKYCYDCHADDLTEADIDLAAASSMELVRSDVAVWQKVGNMLETHQMPPKEAEQPSDEEWLVLERWVNGFLKAEAAALAGDPGPVVLRRLSNAEYTYTLRDLTGVPSMDPAREFPVDGAAGEGFTNTGSALVMSPALVMKYLDAAKSVAEHMVLLPDGIRFSTMTTRRDWTNEQLAGIREFYARFTDSRGGTAVNLQGIQFDTNQGGRLPFDEYLIATLEERDALLRGDRTIDEVASERGLHAKYLGLLWQTLADEQSAPRSFVIDALRRQWREADSQHIATLSQSIQQWQKTLWKFNAVGQVGRQGGPSGWQEAVNPLTFNHEFRIPLPEAEQGQEIIVRLAAGDGGDGDKDDVVLWANPRIENAGRPPVALRDARGLHERIVELRKQALAKTERYLAVVSDAEAEVDVEALAAANELDPAVLAVWLRLLDISARGPVDVSGHFTERMERGGNYDFIQGWGSPQTPSLSANASDQEVRIPGIARPHSIVAHPSPTLFVAAGWRSPITGIVTVEARISDAHPECGNGVEWLVLHRFGSDSNTLARGEFDVAGSAEVPAQTLAVREGEVVALVLGPRQGNHSCDLTDINLVITEMAGEKRTWDLAADVSGDLLKSNPHADRLGNEAIWHFYQGEMASLGANAGPAITVPPGSLLAAWQSEPRAARRQEIARDLQTLVTGAAPTDQNSPDALLYRYVHSLVTPSYGPELLARVDKDERFGQRPPGIQAGETDLVVQAPAVTEFRLPAEMASGGELVVSGRLAAGAGGQGSVQLQVVIDGEPQLSVAPDVPFVVSPDSGGEQRVAEALESFRQLFPIALCYTQIVPVDEVVTLQLFYREDELLQRLMLTDEETTQLNRMWDELLYVSQEPIALTVAFEQLSEFATQDRPDIVVALEPMREPLNERADRFRERLVETEPVHLEAVVQFADRAWRRPLTPAEQQGLRDLYGQLRQAELSHEDAVRLTLARILTAPAFLYRLEEPPAGEASGPVSQLELANRLSYFLWSTLPDESLVAEAHAGQLSDPDILLEQTSRMLQDERAGRMAIHFACQWLGIRDFDQHDEKNEKLYPDFVDVRGAMYEESVRFFDDMIRHDGSVLDLLAADHTFVNGTLADYYGLTGVSGDQWQRVEGVQQMGRGGVLAMATVLSKQSGASRTSPILRGNWVYETLLGQKLPRPPANVPQLPESLPSGLSARQLIEQHSSVPACAKCHERIDHFGFALEQFDAVGRLRPEPADTKTRTQDGLEIEGLEGLRRYLLTERRDEVVRQFCRKLLGYALGRGLQLSDEPLLEDMQTRLAANDYRFSEAVKAIVASRQFQEIRGRDMVAQ